MSHLVKMQILRREGQGKELRFRISPKLSVMPVLAVEVEHVWEQCSRWEGEISIRRLGNTCVHEAAEKN